ncbi:MAG: DUF4446 family protein [Clostridiaceae bacterium]|jgi:hypothetical protein|nr:DUF4446 family protein [Clostridiaceae bacterium]
MEEYIVYISLTLAFLAIIFFFILNVRLGRMIKKYNNFMKGLGDKDVENLMTYYRDEMEKLKKEVHGNYNSRITEIENKLPGCIRNIGITNYNAFEDVGNEMSFSVAFLNEKVNGFILTGIYSRAHSYVYTKEIINGKAKRELSKEERDALNKALA